MLTQEVRLAGEQRECERGSAAPSTATSSATTARACSSPASRTLPAFPTAGQLRRRQGRPVLLRPALQAQAVRALRRGHLIVDRPVRPHRRPAVLQLQRRPHADVRRHLRRPGRASPAPRRPNGVAPRLIASYKVERLDLVQRPDLQGLPPRRHQRPAERSAVHRRRSRARTAATTTGRTRRPGTTRSGTKSRAQGGGAFNVSAFYMDINDLQATVTAGSCSSRLIFNVPEARSTGVELELAQDVEHNFDYAISASYNDSKLRFDGARYHRPHPGRASRRATGCRRVPKLQVQAAATYQQHDRQRPARLPDGQLPARGLALHTDRRPGGGLRHGEPELLHRTRSAGRSRSRRSRSTLSCRRTTSSTCGWACVIDRWDVALFVNNLGDESAQLALDQERGTRARVGYLTNQPRTFGLTTRVHF